MKLRRLSTRERTFEKRLAALTRDRSAQDPKVEKAVRRIIAENSGQMNAGRMIVRRPASWRAWNRSAAPLMP